MEEDLSLKLSMLEMGDESSLDQHPVHEQSEEQNQHGSENCNLIVNYLPHDIDDLTLKGLFMEFGEIVMTKVVTDRTTKKSLGYGFVKFLREDDAMLAIQRLNGFTIDHKCLKVSVARPPSLEIKNCKLYVTNLPRDYSENEVINLFKEFGDIIECRVLRDRNARSNKGVAFVQFDNKAQANNALSLNGCQLEGSSRGLVVKYAEDQHKKREMNRLQSLTSNNVYRYLAPGAMQPPPTHMGMSIGDPTVGPGADPSKMMNRGREKQEALASSYYYPAPQQHQQGQGHHQHPAGAGGGGVLGQQQQQHGLGGINAVYSGGATVHHLQVPTHSAPGMQGGGGGLPSPIMGSVSPNHFLYQQQQMLQQQLPMPAPPSPMMGFSPGGMRRVKGGKGMGMYDLNLLPESQHQQQQYNQWYSAPGQQQPQQQQMTYLSSGSGSPHPLHSPQHHLHMQQRQLQSQLQGQSLDINHFNGGMLSVNTMGGNPGNRSPIIHGMSYHQHHQPQQQQYSPLGGNLQTFQAQHSGSLQPSQQMHASAYHQSHQGGGVHLQQHHQQQHPQHQQQPQVPLYAVPPQHDGAPVVVGAGGGGGGPKAAGGGYNGTYQNPGASGGGSVTLNIANLPSDADVALLHELFSPHGRILSAQIDLDTSAAAASAQQTQSGAPAAAGAVAGRVSVCSGRGCVQLADLAQAQSAVQALNGSSVYHSEAPLQVSIAGSGLSGTK